MQASVDQPNDLSGSILGGQFRLLERLGRGGMGDVYLAEQLDLGRSVVVKVLRAASDVGGEERFLREARALARLNHPNIVHVYAFGRTEQGTLYFAMEYLPGRTLGGALAEHAALSEPQALAILEQLCAALAEAHTQGIIHRDLKPDNVMLVPSTTGQPHVKVLDFGIAQLLHAREPPITQRGEIIGTPLYMAPEQLSGRALDERTDLYALGLIGYELLTGNLPFGATTTADVLARAVREEVPIPSRDAPHTAISPRTDALITRCLQRDPDARFQSAQELREAVAHALQATGAPRAASSAAPPSLVPHDGPALRISDADTRCGAPSRRARTRRGMLFMSVSVSVGALGLVVLGATVLDTRRPIPATRAPDRLLMLQEWVQGIPFPEGTRYVSFEPELIEAHVSADTRAVLAFYRAQLADKWGGYEELSGGMLFDGVDALIETLTAVADDDSGTRLLITRRRTRGSGSDDPSRPAVRMP